MAPNQRFTREDVIQAAYELIRREGPAAFNARNVAKELGSSTQPIFRLFTGMDELRAEVMRKADADFCALNKPMAAGDDCPYLQVCMSYLHFAKNEPQLFRLLFMRDRVSDGSCMREYSHSWGIPVIQESFGVSKETALDLYARTFFYVHGLAVCLATKYIACLDDAQTKKLLRESLHAASTELGIAID